MQEFAARNNGATPTLFAFQDERIRVTVDAAGEPWFVAADVCRVLDVQNVTDAIKCLDGDDLDSSEVIDSIGRTQKANTVSEAGLYQLIFASRKPEAKAFKRWVTKEVIPAIRKTGQYQVAAPALPKSFPEALRALADAEEAKLALALENSELRPKAEFFDAVTASEDTLGMNETAKLLSMGRNKMMAQLRKLHVFRFNNTPYQEYLDAGYFKVVESKWADSKGDSHVTLSTRVFQRGVEFIRKKLTKEAK